MTVASLIALWGRVRDGLLQTISRFTQEELDFIPYKGGFSVRETILHIAQEEYGEFQYGIKRDLVEFPTPYEEERYATAADLVDLLAEVNRATLDYLAQLDEDDLEMEVEAGWGGRFPLLSMIWHIIEHEIHHRGELSLMLGLLGREGLDA
jgi:uncharacterized damage-inducible protein DinB